MNTTGPTGINPATLAPPGRLGAVLDDAHVGDIRGALGTIRRGDVAPRRRLSRRLKTMLAILGPGLIVMVGDNDAGAFGTYTQAGQNYGTHLLWTLQLLIPVLYVNQEMLVRLGAVTGVGHARLILERFGKFWGAFSVIDLFLLNALTIVTEFIGISLACNYLGLPKIPTVILAATLVIAAVSTGSFRRFERLCLVLVAGSLTLIPVYLIDHPATGQMIHDFFVPGLPGGSSQLSTVMLLIIAIVGTTVAPWQLFFQQSYIVDKGITPRFMRSEKADLIIGIGLVIIGAAAMMGFCNAVFAGTPQFGPLHRRRWHRRWPRPLRLPGRGCPVRDRATGCEHHRRRRRRTCHRLRNQRRPQRQPLAAPACYPGQGVLRLLRGSDGGRCRTRPSTRRAAWHPDQRCADTRRRAAPQRHRVPAAAVQRQGRARPVG
jgi:hypothetical protein